MEPRDITLIMEQANNHIRKALNFHLTRPVYVTREQAFQAQVKNKGDIVETILE